MKKSLQSSFLVITLCLASITAIVGCKGKGASLAIPTVEISQVVTGLKSTTVTVYGRNTVANIITENGICFSATNKTPTISDIKKTDTVGARWDINFTALVPGQTYYFRAYATNDAGTGYSDVLTVTMPATDAVPTGTVTTFAGSISGANGYAEGIGAAALFDGPQNISYNPQNSLLYVSDTYNNAIRTITTSAATATLNVSPVGYADGALNQARFYGPRGIAFDATGNAYVADLGNNVIRKISTGGVVSTLAGNTIPGYINDVATKAEFFNPTATVADASGNVYVADRSNNVIRKITPDGVVSHFSGYQAPAGYSQHTLPGYVDGDANTSYYNYPVALAMDAAGSIYVADNKNNAIRLVNSKGEATTFAGGLNYPKIIGSPTSIAFDAQGNMFIVDSNGRILEITNKKVLYVIAGAAGTSGLQDGVGAAARFSNPQSIAIDSQGNLYVADYNNNVIRKITVAVQ
ncbi:hypothetical protein ACFS5N_09540 [Mucilaginibacter ximonensis]|uniref:NHL repeat-containing protein n=1 Tax=Mucilaginibacter ximonensis TaxID=538021 RepID=A0ABW5YBR7_9SPHI